MVKKPELKFHDKMCFNCRYYRISIGSGSFSDCLLLGRTLSLEGLSGYADRARYCDGWKRRPKNWDITAEKNPQWFDKYISRETLMRLRKWEVKKRR